MREKYNHHQIEKKWQAYWFNHKTFKSDVDTQKEKYYILDMFPYPSGAGLHVGHPLGYTATDILARYKRQKGFNVLHPMGFDSFGLPAERYAQKTGQHPAISTKSNIDNFRKQLQTLGFSYDWDREIATSDPDYYKWTQWIFTLLFEKGLAYEAEIEVNYCPELGCVLANEEVENGVSVEGGFPIEKRPLKQWMLKITAYAQQLLDGLDDLDWPDYLKQIQRNWIGRSEGVEVNFAIAESDQQLACFTTRIDTLFGVSFLVLAPEHPDLDRFITPSQQGVVENYIQEVANKSERERNQEKDKSGIWTGSFALHPLTGEKLPIYVADYVLMGYGTGAVMAVPTHDERDFQFAQKYDLPIKAIIDSGEELPTTTSGPYIDSACEDFSLSGKTLEEAKEIVTKHLEKEGKATRRIYYKLRDWLFSRQRYWGEPMPIHTDSKGIQRALGKDELPLMPPELSDYYPSSDGRSPLAKATDWVESIDPKTGEIRIRETNTMPQWAGSCWYYLRFCDPKNSEEAFSKEAESYWMPVDMYVGGVEHAVLHLLYARFWHHVLYDAGLVSTKEPFQALRNQGLITSISHKLESGGYVHASEVADGKHTVTGERVISQSEKMSKSKLNGVDPSEVIDSYGADTLRIYEMFMGPFEEEKVWNHESIVGSYRFLNRIFDLIHSDKVKEIEDEKANKLIHRLIEGVEKDICQMQFNTAIAKMMEFLNHFSKCDVYPKSALEKLVLLLSPFAPHISEELWETLGHTTTLAYTPFPTFDEKYLIDEQTTMVIQVGGKFRGRVEVPKGLTQDQALALAKEHPVVGKYLDKEILKVIYVPDKLINIVVKM